MTVNNEAAGNRTDTLNSSICSKSTVEGEKRELRENKYEHQWREIRQINKNKRISPSIFIHNYKHFHR